MGTPDEQHISTSFVERQNLSVRMTNRRYTRLTNGFSKKIENHAASVALGYFAYNFIKIHRTLRTSPAMAAGVADRLWDVSDLVALWEAEERTAERALSDMLAFVLSGYVFFYQLLELIFVVLFASGVYFIMFRNRQASGFVRGTITVAFFAVSGYVIGAFLMGTGGGSGALIGAVVGGIIWGSFLRKTSK